MQVTPLHDKVLVELDASEDDFGDSGIARPDIARDMPVTGTVRGVGPGKINKRGRLIPTTLVTGDRVMVPWARGHQMSIGGKTFRFVAEYAEDQILGYVD